MKKRFLLLLILCCFLVSCSEQKAIERNIFAMDTMMNVRIWGEEDALDSVCDLIHRLDATLSAENEQSEIYKLNHEGIFTASKETAELVAEAIRYSGITSGSFDPTIYPYVSVWKNAQELPNPDDFTPLKDYIGTKHLLICGNTITLSQGTMLDLGGIGKGYAAQKCIELLTEKNVKCAILSLGGNVQTLGTKPDGSKWAVGISDPQNPTSTIAVVRFVGAKALVTSGSYQRYYEFDGTKYHHILDPDSGFPAENELASVTIITDNGTKADAFSTALFVMGLEKATDFWKSRDDFEAVFVLNDGQILATKGAASLLTDCEFTVIER